MSVFSLFVVYLLIWWVTLFAVLPFGVVGQIEKGEIVNGSELGAPAESKIKKKAVITTVVATIIWLLVCSIIISGLLSWDILAELFNIDKLSEE
jgi:predicted secreted protein